MEMEKENKSNKNLFIAIGCALLVVAVVIVLVLLLGKEKSNEEELKKNLEKLGSQFYTEFYYPAQERSQKDVASFIAQFEKTGIKVNLENIAKVSKVDKDLINSMVNSKTDKECDKAETYVVIKPTKPYGKNDFKVSEVKLVCGFDKEETKKETTKKETKKTETKKETTKKETTETKKK